MRLYISTPGIILADMSDNYSDINQLGKAVAKLVESDRYKGVMLEELLGQNKAILEAVGDMQRHVADIPQMKEDIGELKSDMKIVKAAVTANSRDIHDHEHRITILEAGA